MALDSEQIIEKCWLGYKARVIPDDASLVQVIECRRAFYAGAGGLFFSIMTILDPGTDATQKDLNRMTSIEAELKRFQDKVRNGLA